MENGPLSFYELRSWPSLSKAFRNKCQGPGEGAEERGTGRKEWSEHEEGRGGGLPGPTFSNLVRHEHCTNYSVRLEGSQEKTKSLATCVYNLLKRSVKFPDI